MGLIWRPAGGAAELMRNKGQIMSKPSHDSCCCPAAQMILLTEDIAKTPSQRVGTPPEDMRLQGLTPSNSCYVSVLRPSSDWWRPPGCGAIATQAGLLFGHSDGLADLQHRGLPGSLAVGQTAVVWMRSKYFPATNGGHLAEVVPHAFSECGVSCHLGLDSICGTAVCPNMKIVLAALFHNNALLWLIAGHKIECHLRHVPMVPKHLQAT